MPTRAKHCRTGFAALCLLALLGLGHQGRAHAQSGLAPARAGETVGEVAAPPRSSAADDIAAAFSTLGSEIYEDCIFELSDEQVEVQAQLVIAYMAQGADGATARKLAASQIQPPKLSKRCEELRRSPEKAQGRAPIAALEDAPAAVPDKAAEPPSSGWSMTLEVHGPSGGAAGPPKAQSPDAKRPANVATPAPAKPPVVVAALPPPPKAVSKPVATAALPAAAPPAKPAQTKPASAAAALAGKQMLAQWDCGPEVDYVTVQINGYPRKLSGGEICNPYEDVVREVPEGVTSFRLGYTIRTGRLFVISDDASANGRTIAWAISGRDVCRNNPDPDCFAARAIGPLPPGEYTFNSDKARRINFGPKTKRNVAGIYLKKLWNKDRFSPAQVKAILARGNIAIHARLKGEMSEACLGLEPKGWAYVAGLIKDGRATGVNVYIDEPHPQIAEAPPLVAGSGFSLTSLFK